MFLTVADGLVLKLSFNFLLSATPETFTYISSTESSEFSSLNSSTSFTTNTTLLLSNVTNDVLVESVLSVSGSVVDLSSASNDTTLVLANVVTDQQPVLNLQALQRNSSARLSLPSWVEVVSTSYTKAKLSGITSLGLTDVTYDASNVSIRSWDQQ